MAICPFISTLLWRANQMLPSTLGLVKVQINFFLNRNSSTFKVKKQVMPLQRSIMLTSVCISLQCCSRTGAEISLKAYLCFHVNYKIFSIQFRSCAWTKFKGSSWGPITLCFLIWLKPRFSPVRSQGNAILLVTYPEDCIICCAAREGF